MAQGQQAQICACAQSGILGAFNGGAYSIFVHSTDDDQVNVLLNESINLLVLVCQVELCILYIQRGAQFVCHVLCAFLHGGEERIGHVLNHQANRLDLSRLR